MYIFISHAEANKNIAEELDKILKETSNDVETFISSRSGDIRADDEWCDRIENELQKADIYIILLTPESVLRPWVNFEAGAGRFFEKQDDKKLILLRIKSLSTKDIPLPISRKQVYAIDDKEQLIAVFDSLGLTLNEPDLAVKKLAEQTAQAVPTGDNEPAWEGILINGVFYAWAGPLLGLEEREKTYAPPNLLDEIKKRGLTPRWCVEDKIGKHTERGLALVFATDKKKWKCHIVDRKLLLMVSHREQ